MATLRNSYTRSGYDPYEADPTAGTSGQFAPAATDGTNWLNAYGSNPAYGQISTAYQNFLGRAGSPEEIMSHLGFGSAMAPSNVQWALSSIMGSPEAQAYRTSQATPAPQPTPTTPAPTPAPAPAPAGRQPSSPTSPVTSTGAIPPPTPAPTAASVPVQPAPQAPGYGQTTPSDLTTAEQALLMQILGSPESVSPLMISQMKERNKEELIAQQQAIAQQIAQGAAGRGVLEGGQVAANQQRLARELALGLTSSNRAVDIGAMQQNFQDRLNTLGSAEGVLSGHAGRTSDTYRNMLAQYQAEQQAQQSALANALSGAGLEEQGRQFNWNWAGSPLQWSSLLSGDELGRMGLGINAAQLQAMQQQQLFNLLFG